VAPNSEDDLRVVGLLSGTSMDGIDVAVADLRAAGGELELTPLGHFELPYPGQLGDRLRAALPPNPCSAGELTELDTGVGQAFAAAAEQGIAELGGGRADLVASLGQTIFHWVEDGTARGTLQLGQPAWIAERTGLPVVADLRVRDLVAGGHGAPLAGTFDALWLRSLARSQARPAAALNIGGIANLTVVAPDGGVQAYDTGPGNALMDLAAAEVTGGRQHRDTGGLLAARGTVRTDLLERLLADTYYAAVPPKSTGKEHFHAGYLAAVREGLPPIGAEDLLATLTELTAVTVAAECERHGAGTVVGSGGGMANPALVRALTARMPGIKLVTSEDLGLPGAAKEAYLTAVLGWLTWHGLPGNIPAATGATGPRLLGSVTPGSGPLTLPPPSTTPVSGLRVARPDQTR
jgi:anhydro-N-acetylmuramic acid kinase